jgi:tetratricopeptide (TPR) repeat protein
MANGRKLGLLVSLLGVFAVQSGGAQGGTGGEAATLSRALDLEGSGKCKEAIPVFRQALGSTDDPAGALYGLERCVSEAGASPDTLLFIIDSVLAKRPRDPVARTIQLRTLTNAQRADAARLAFQHWVNAVPGDATPFREFARLLLDAGLTRTADTVLTFAMQRLGGGRQVAAELAELKGALGMWEASATNWRQAMTYAPYLEASAVFVLGAATGAARDTIRGILAADPKELNVRRILSGVEMRWTSPREAWAAIAVLTPTDSVVEAWLQFAADAEERESWLVARDAYAAALGKRRQASLVVRTATAALQGGEPASALAWADSLVTWKDSSQAAPMALIRLRALGQLGRAAAADSLLQTRMIALDPVTRGDAVRAVAWAWVRMGDVARARATLVSGGEESDERSAAWMALYEGDLKTARTGLRRLDEVTRDAVLALSVLARTRGERSEGIGRAFLALARSDTAAAAKEFESTAKDVADASPLLLAIAARLYRSTSDSARSEAIWDNLIKTYPQSPEAAESDLEWAKVLRRQGNTAAAIARLEHLILTYPQSALVFQARRELEIAKGTIPPVPGHATENIEPLRTLRTPIAFSHFPRRVLASFAVQTLYGVNSL